MGVIAIIEKRKIMSLEEVIKLLNDNNVFECRTWKYYFSDTIREYFFSADNHTILLSIHQVEWLIGLINERKFNEEREKQRRFKLQLRREKYHKKKLSTTKDLEQ